MVTSLKDTKLFEKLKNGYLEEDKIFADVLSSKIEELCQISTARMKKVLSLHKEYTLHDEIHLVRVTEIMAMILSDDGIDRLNPMEIGLLILSAYYHDTGMVLDDADISELKASEEYLLYKDNWKLNYPSYNEMLQRLKEIVDDYERSKCLEAISILDSAVFTEFVRKRHGIYSQKIIEREAASDSRWEINGVNYGRIVARIAVAHTKHIDDINEKNGYLVDERVGTYNVNVQFLCVLLRLADILDFDTERTPASLYRSINFTSNISHIEWNKHRSITGWEISADRIRFTAQCTHPVYQRAVLSFMDWIDEELSNCHGFISKFPAYVSDYKLHIPMQVDRSRIYAKDNAYIYHDLEFTISRNEIVKLLMMDQLYGNRSLCIRELLQNSLDALRLRKVQYAYKDISWENGKVQFRHYLDEYGREVLSCQDNGIGMDENIISSFLTKAGRSYYKSPEFENFRLQLKQKNINFTPCSQFGIGFMSCFMLGDEIEIYTRKDYGPGSEQGMPLVVQINGIDGMIVIREGSEEQEVGTTVKIVGRKKPRYFDEWVDKIWLTETLDGYALMCEFPIEASCEIPEIRNKINILPNYPENKTVLEIDKLISYIKSYEYDVHEIDDNLYGKMKVSFIKDDNNNITLDNGIVKVEIDLARKENTIKLLGETILEYWYDEKSSICCDGILVCGEPGRNRSHMQYNRLGGRANVIHLGTVDYVVDIRNDLKPRLSPARIPDVGPGNDPHRSWFLVEEKLEYAIGKIWDDVFSDLSTLEQIKIGIAYALLYNFSFVFLSSQIIIEKLYIPLKNGCEYWKKLSDIDEFVISHEKILCDGNAEIIEPTDMIEYRRVRDNYSISYCIKSAILNISIMDLQDGIVYLRKKRIYEVEDSCDFYRYRIRPFGGIRMVEYSSRTMKYFCILTEFRSINKEHAYSKYIYQNRFSEERNELLSFLLSLMFLVTDKESVVKLIDDSATSAKRRLGCLYKDIIWESAPIQYEDIWIWEEEVGEFVITREMLLEWAEYEYDEVKDI